MRHQLLIIIILAIVANFIFLSIGFSQEGVQLQGIVPLTEKNMQTTIDSNLNRQSEKPVTKENKYLQFFDKGLELEQEEGKLIKSQNQTSYDKVASYGLMALILLVFAALLVFILRGVDKLILKS